MSKIAALALMVVVCDAQTRSTQDAEAGRSTYRLHCASCHGPNAQGGKAPDLTRGLMRSANPDRDLFRTISDGISGSEMASYSGRLKPEEINRIIAFLHSAGRQDGPVPGDPAAGESLFWEKGGCGNCHAIGNRGNRVGPGLTRIGRQRGLSFLRDSIVSPSADVPRDYQGVTVVTHDGKTIRGIARALDSFSVVFTDFSGKTYSFDRADLKSVSRDTASLMPEYGNVFTTAELTNLLAYLAAQGREK